jgi:acetoacetyl-CoA synthetase
VIPIGSIPHDRQVERVARAVKPVPVQSISGGSDVIGWFVLGSPELPV